MTMVMSNDHPLSASVIMLWLLMHHLNVHNEVMTISNHSIAEQTMRWSFVLPCEAMHPIYILRAAMMLLIEWFQIIYWCELHIPMLMMMSDYEYDIAMISWRCVRKKTNMYMWSS